VEIIKKKLKGDILVPGKKGRDAAVCVLFNSHYEILLIKRPDNPEDPWSGQVSFPGGHFEPEDVYLNITALRELREETGITDAEIIGLMDVEHPRNFPGMDVYPFVCFREEFGELRKQKGEVSYFLMPRISDLKRLNKNIKVGNNYSIEECFVYGNDIIWGMTYRIISHLMDLFQDH
jgi:8-oxo-dGTP pyrophosphatase MutT (NUDIX family)